MTKKMSAFLISLGLFVMPTVAYAIEDNAGEPAGGNVVAEVEVTAQNLLDLIDTSISLDIKESEALKTSDYAAETEALNEKIVAAVKAYLLEKGQNIDDLGFKVFGDVEDSISSGDIHKTKLTIYKGSERVSKTIDLTYSNTSSKKDEDKTYVESKIKDINIDTLSFEDINAEDHEEINYDELLKNAVSQLNASDIKVVIAPTAGGGDGCIWETYIIAYFYKDDVLYATKTFTYTRVRTIEVPASVGTSAEGINAYVLSELNEFFKDGWSEDGKSIVTGMTKISTLGEVYKDNTNSSKSDYLYKVDFIDEYKNYNFVFGIKVEESTKIVDGLYVPVNSLNGIEVKGEALDKKSDVYKEMVNHLNKKGFSNIYNAYEITLASGTINGKLQLQFSVGTENNGKKALVLHKKHDGTLEELSGEVKNGMVNVEVTELSPFIVALEGKSNNSQTSSMNIALYGVLAVSAALGIAYLLKSKKASN